MRTLLTERLLIRNITQDDWVDLHQIILEKESSAYAIYDRPWPADLEELQRCTAELAENDQLIGVCQHNSDALVGYYLILPSEAHGEGTYDVGFVFHPAYHHWGFATESCLRVFQHLFETVGARRIICRVAAANSPAVRLLNRLQMKQIHSEVIAYRHYSDGTPIEFVSVTYEKCAPAVQAEGAST